MKIGGPKKKNQVGNAWRRSNSETNLELMRGGGDVSLVGIQLVD